MKQEIKRWGLLLAVALLLPACAISPKSGKWQARSDGLLTTQLARLPAPAVSPSVAEGSRQFFLGMALHSESNAFQGDLGDVSALLTGINPAMQMVTLSNHPANSDLDRPFATRENFNRAMDALAAYASPRNLVVILMTSHGVRGSVVVSIAGEHYPALSAEDIRKQLDRLRSTPTVLIVSSCYSGTLIPALRARNRIILTAASDRPSFGCQADSKNSFFIEELFKRNFSADLSIKALHAQTREQVRVREASFNFPFSDPQLFVGAGMQAAAELPLRQLLQGQFTISQP